MIIFDGVFSNNEPLSGKFYYNNGIKISECDVITFDNELINSNSIYKDRYLIWRQILLFHDDGSIKFEGNLIKKECI